MVSYPVNPVIIPIELMVQSLGPKENLVALLDSGYTRCLVNPALVEKLTVRLKQLKVPIVFYQLDISMAWGFQKHLLLNQ